jgi:hypothetical protein
MLSHIVVMLVRIAVIILLNFMGQGTLDRCACRLNTC